MKLNDLNKTIPLKITTPRSAQSDLRALLQDELIKRIQKNRKYSLRSFAKALNVDPSSLSQFLRGKRSLSQKNKVSIIQKLALHPSQISKSISIYSDSSSDVTETVAHNLALDAFTLIADWYHYAIFELISIQNFKADTKWIAQQLSISTIEVADALERLKRLELISIDSKGTITTTESLVSTAGNPFTAAAFRKLQKQVLEMAIVALEETPMEYRDQSSMTMAINSNRINEAKDYLKKFRRKFCAQLQNDSKRDAVYQLSLSFYPLTKLNHKGDLK
ncbi:MAG: TIGR02147 family protein [Bdellovibrionales bacterium]